MEVRGEEGEGWRRGDGWWQDNNSNDDDNDKATTR